MKTKRSPESEFRRLFSFGLHCDHKLHNKTFVEPEVDLTDSIRQSLNSNNTPLIMIIGAWGAGKTLQLERSIHLLKNEYKFRKLSFFGCPSLKEGLFHLVPFTGKIVLAAFFGALISFTTYELLQIEKLIPSAHLYWIRAGASALMLFIGVSVFTNRERLAYLVHGYFASSFSFLSSKVLVLEDLDRSSMPESERWALLATLWSYRRKYIISYGYSGSEERVRLYEIALKLEAKLIELPLNFKVNHQIAKEIFPDFPWTASEWLSKFSPRELGSMLFDIRDSLPKGASSSRAQAEMIRQIYPVFMERALPIPEHRDRISWSFRGATSPSLSAAIGLRLTTSEDRLVQSFASSIEPSFLLALEHSALGPEKTSVNWFEVLFNKMMKTPEGDPIAQRLG